MLTPTRTDGKRPPGYTRLTFTRCHSGERLSDTAQLEDAVAPLVRRAQDGDAGARDKLLRRCHATVYRWALVYTGDPDDADDVAQDVLVRLATRLDRYTGRSRFTTWLYQVTRNAALGFGRQVASTFRLARRENSTLSRRPKIWRRLRARSAATGLRSKRSRAATRIRISSRRSRASSSSCRKPTC